ncbi:MAG TPA: DUF502 domain-containing protein [Planctomycetota bacterium]
MPPDSKKPNGLAAFFFRGVVTLLPVVLTVVIFGLLFQMVNRYVTGPINAVIYWSLERNAVGWGALEGLGIDPLGSDYLAPELLPVDIQTLARSPEGFDDPRFRDALVVHRHDHLGFFRDLDDLAIRSERLRDDVKKRVHPLIGVLVSLLLVLWLGWLVGGFVGRRFVQHLDRTMTLIPVVKSIYPYSKQLVEFFFEKKKIEFDTVVAIPYPSDGLWALAFVTNGSMRTLDQRSGKELVCVFLPTSPMPMTGYTLFVDVERVITLPIPIEEAVRLVMTGGVLIPTQERVVRSVPGVLPSEPPPPAVPLPGPRQESA